VADPQIAVGIRWLGVSRRLPGFSPVCAHTAMDEAQSTGEKFVSQSDYGSMVCMALKVTSSANRSELPLVRTLPGESLLPLSLLLANALSGRRRARNIILA